jgi:hypothetical protein
VYNSLFMKRFFLFLLTCLPFLSNAQSNYKPGYLISNTGDSIPGFINYKEREQNPVSFIFRVTADSPSKTYNISDAKGYGVNGIEKYERYLVDISQSKEALADVSVGLDSTTTRNTVFLKVIQTGKKVSMYAYSDPIKTRYYLKEGASSEPYELIYSVYRIDETGQVKDYNKYIRQLTVLLLNNDQLTPEVQSKVQALTYGRGPILKIVSVLNGQKAEKAKKGTRFFLGAAYNSSKASYTGKTVFNGPGVTNKTSYAPMLTAGVDLFANPAIGRVIYRLELSFTSAKSDIYAPNTDPTIDYKEHSFDSYGGMLTPQVIWNVFNTKPVKVFIGAGAALNYSAYQNNVTTTKWKATSELLIQKDRTELNKFYYAPQASAGIVLNSKVELFGNYMFKAMVGNLVNEGLAMERLNLGVKYLFGK